MRPGWGRGGGLIPRISVEHLLGARPVPAQGCGMNQGGRDPCPGTEGGGRADLVEEEE